MISEARISGFLWRSNFVIIILVVTLVLGALIMIEIEITESINGAIQPENLCEIRLLQAGSIARVYVQEGAWVDSGCIVAELHTDEYFSRAAVLRYEIVGLRAGISKCELEIAKAGERSQAEQTIATAGAAGAYAELQNMQHGPHIEQQKQAEANVEVARVSVAEAEAAAQRGVELAHIGAITMIEYEQRMNAAETARQILNAREAEMRYLQHPQSSYDEERGVSQYRQARATVDVARSELKVVQQLHDELANLNSQLAATEEQLRFAENALAMCAIRAPRAGRVITPGLELLAGRYFPAGSLVMAVASGQRMVFRGQMPEKGFSQVRVGQSARIFLTAFSYDAARQLHGTVSEKSVSFMRPEFRTDETTEPQQTEAQSQVKISLTEPVADLIPDSSAVFPNGLTGRCDIIVDSGNIFGVGWRWMKKKSHAAVNYNFHL